MKDEELIKEENANLIIIKKIIKKIIIIIRELIRKIIRKFNSFLNKIR